MCCVDPATNPILQYIVGMQPFHARTTELQEGKIAILGVRLTHQLARRTQPVQPSLLTRFHPAVSMGMFYHSHRDLRDRHQPERPAATLLSDQLCRIDRFEGEWTDTM